MSKQNSIEPQPGFQTNFLSNPADIIIGGSGAGVGKTFALLMDVLRYTIPQFNQKSTKFSAVIFRRETPQIRNPGGLWDESMQLFPLVAAKPSSIALSWEFPTGAKCKFSHLQYDTDKLAWQGSQIPYIGFDELTHFSEEQFFYLLSRNRSVCGIKPVVRATCNPDPDSWVAEFIEWWIDQDENSPNYGRAIPERDGKIRYFIKSNGQFIWGNTKEEVIELAPFAFEHIPKEINPLDLVKSVSFIKGSIYDNKKLLSVNPEYLANLKSLSEQEQSQLLDSNWKVRLDNLALGNYNSIINIFSNYLEKDQNSKRYITVDVAGYGQDLAVIKTWEGWKVLKCDILTKSSPEDIENLIEKNRSDFLVTKSDVLIDNDGMGWGLSGKGYTTFNNNSKPIDSDKIDSNFKNLKTQCYYGLFGKIINENKLSMKDTVFTVDGVETNFIQQGKKTIKIEDLIKADLRSIKRKNPDEENKKQINSKIEQKVILGGRSPDFSDCLMMRYYFELFGQNESEGSTSVSQTYNFQNEYYGESIDNYYS